MLKHRMRLLRVCPRRVPTITHPQRDGGIPLVEDVSLRECPDGDILLAIAHRAGEMHVGSLAADILWEWYAYFLYFNLRMDN